MTRTAVISCVLLLAVALSWTYARRRHSVAGDQAPPATTESTENGVILPAVSAGWSNLTNRAQASAAFFPGSSSLTDTQQVAAAEEVVQAEADPNLSTMGARAKELMAQVALASVGVDPDADQYWVAAVNDPNVSAAERRALILELNQAGFPDPRRPSTDDLPLIASRIALLEQIGAAPIDSANASAFDEVYRDLLGMFASVAAPADASINSPDATAGGAQ